MQKNEFRNLCDEGGYQLQSHQLRRVLGLPKRLLPDTSLDPTAVGDTEVVVYDRHLGKCMSPKATRPHRIYAKCNTCLRWIPAGRLHQHRKSHKSK